MEPIKITKVELEVIVKLDKNIFNKWIKSMPSDEFLYIYIIRNISSDNMRIKNVINNLNDNEISKYQNYFQTLNTMARDIVKSINYQILSKVDNIEIIKINFNFSYYNNTILSIDKTIEYEIFDRVINKNENLIYTLSSNKNLLQYEYNDNKINSYRHSTNCWKEAKSNVLVNGIGLQFKERNTE